MPKTLLRAKNPNNQYIIDQLHEMKMKCLRQSQDKVAFIYQKIIGSLQKYPMPLLCEEQIQQLQGVGEKTACIILRMVKQQYAKFELCFQKMNDAILFDELQIIPEEVENELYQQPQNYSDSCPPSLICHQIQNLCIDTLNFSNYQPQKRKDHSFKDDLLIDLKKDIKQNDNNPSKSKKPYNPGKSSKSGQILIGLHKFQQDQNKIYASKREIKDYCRNINGMDIGNWTVVETLEKHSLIQKTVLDNQVKYALTNEGIKLGEQYTVEHNIEQGHQNKPDEWEIVLLIDNRERFHSNNRQIIYEKMKSIYNTNCRLSQLPVGDFVWIAKQGHEEYVCDFIVERKTLSDLASSIIDKRYMEQKHRLKHCGIKNIFYLIENTQSTNLCLPKQTLDKAIRSTQIRDGFCIQQTENLEDSLQWISLITKRMNVSSKQNLMRYSDFIYQNSSKSETLFNLWGSMLRGISGIGLQSAKQIASSWNTPNDFVQAIKSGTELEDIIKQQSKERQLPHNILRLLETLFKDVQYSD